MSLATATIQENYRSHLPRVRCDVYRADELALTFGEQVSGVEFRYAVYGDIRKPAVIVLGGISADCYPFDGQVDGAEVSGWWHALVKEGCATLLEDFCVIGVEFWAGERCQKPLKISTIDQAKLLAGLLDEINIDQLHCLIGSSYGGMVALAFCQLFPQRARSAIILCAAEKAHARATASRVLQRRIVSHGIATGTVCESLALARSLAMLSYRGADEIEQRFANQIDPSAASAVLPIEGYFDCHGERFAKRFDPWRFLNLSQSIDLHLVDLNEIRVPLTLIGFEGDQVVPPEQMISMQKRLAAASPKLHGETNYVEIKTPYGHDGFLKETRQLKPIIEAALRQPEYTKCH